MMMQQLFCFLAYSTTCQYLQRKEVAIGTYLRVEHLALCRQAIAFCNQLYPVRTALSAREEILTESIFSPRSRTLSIVLCSCSSLASSPVAKNAARTYHNLRLIQLPLDLHNVIRLARVLIFDNVVLELR